MRHGTERLSSASIARPHEGHQGPRVPACRPGHGVQAHRVRATPLAHGQRAPHLVALVRAGATIVNGKLIERPDDQPPAANSASPVAAQEVTARAA